MRIKQTIARRKGLQIRGQRFDEFGMDGILGLAEDTHCLNAEQLINGGWSQLGVLFERSCCTL